MEYQKSGFIFANIINNKKQFKMKMTNVLHEFIKAAGFLEKVLCSEIIFTDNLGDSYTFILKADYTQKDLILFLVEINIFYCNTANVADKIGGIIWVTKDSYFIREKDTNSNEYFWKFNINETIAEHLL